MIGETGSDGRGRAEGLVDSAEEVVHEVDAYAVVRFSTFLLNALVSLVNRRIDIRVVRFCRST